MLIPWLNSKIIDELTKNSPLNKVYVFGGCSIFLWFFRATIFTWLRERYEMAYIDYAIPKRMQEVTLSKLFCFSIGQHSSENSGIKHSIINRGESALANLGDLILYQALPLFAEMSILTSILVYWSKPIGLVVLFTMIIYIFTAMKINNYFQKDFREIEGMFIENSKFQSEVLRNITLIITNAKEATAQSECKKSLEKTFNFAVSVWRRFVTLAAFRNSITAISLSIILVICINYTHNKVYTLGQFVMFMTWAVNALGSLGNVSHLHRKFIQSYISVRRYFEMLSIEPDIKMIQNPIRPDKFRGEIEFRNVTLRYNRRGNKKTLSESDDEKYETERIIPALSNISFKVKPGEKIAFVGESGSGKSTIIHTLIRAQDPETGEIIIDGYKLRDLDIGHFRRSIGVVDQDTFLFDDTLRYNITYCTNNQENNVLEEKLTHIAKISCIDGFFSRLEQGFDTIIGERGVKLSGGERQRVGIARALIKEPEILIFDEATSSLDSKNEQVIQESINEASKGRTTLIIAHRFSTIRDADKIIVLDKGVIVGEGTHEELMRKCSVYVNLVNKQIFV